MDKERRLLDCGANGKQPRGGGNECESAGGGMLELEERWKEWINWQILEQLDSTSTLDGHYPIGLARGVQPK